MIEERNLRVLEQEQSRLKAESERVGGEPLDPAKLRGILSNFDDLYTVASAAEKKEMLHLLVQRVVFRGPGSEVTLELFPTVNLTGGSSILRVLWLPSGVCGANFSSSFVLDLEAYRKRRRQAELKVPTVVARLHQAEAFQALLDTGKTRSRTSLAQQQCLTKARVTQLLDLLRLDPLILDYIRQLPAGTPERLVTERKLRRLVKLPPSEQLRVAERRVIGFLAWRNAAAAA